MKIRNIAIAGLLALGLVACKDEATSTTTTPSADTDKLSYTIGYNMGEQFAKQDIDINVSEIQKGFAEGLAEKDSRFTQEERMQIMRNFQQQVMSARMTQMKEAATKNKAIGDKFLAENKAKEGVHATESGLQYRVVTAGTGKKPTKTDTVTVDYTGKLIDGTVFDSSVKRGQPATFKVTQVIPGWTEVLQLMNTGSTFEVFIPADLAYGERGTPGQIGPNETLIFEIKLISIQAPVAKNADHQ